MPAAIPAKKRNFAREIESELRRIIADRPDDELTLGELVEAVLDTGRVDSEMLQSIRENAVTRYIGTVLNRAKISLGDGRKVRAFQSYAKVVQEEGGEKVQQNVWKHLDEMTRKQWMAVCSHRASHIKDSKASLEADNDYWNEKVARKHGYRKVELASFFE